MSSLQCPATLLLVARCDDAEAAEELAGRLTGRRVATVWCGSDAAAQRTSVVLVDLLACASAVRPELVPPTPDEDDAAVAARLQEVLQEAADLHRGETVAVVTDPDLLARAVPRLARTAPHPPGVPPGGVVELEVDEEWWCRSWPSAT